MDKKNEFSQRMKKLRKEHGYSVKEFANMLNIKLQTYYSYEKGRSYPSYEGLQKIAEKCNVSLDWLCGMIPEEDFSTNKRSDIYTILSEILSANEMGKQIEVQISRR